MVADKLLGHTYHMSEWQYAEVMSHIDAELQWQVAECVAMFMDGKQQYYKTDLFEVVSKTVVRCICEREKCGFTLDNRRVSAILLRTYGKLPGNKSAYDQIPNLLIYAVNDALIQIRNIRALTG